MEYMSSGTGLAERVDRYQRAHRWLGLPVAVVYKFLDDGGTYLAGLLTYYGIVSVFPLLLLLNTLLGYVLHNNADLQQQVVNSALRQFPIIGDQIGQNVHSLHGSTVGIVVGVVGALYGGLGIANASQYASNTLWAVPHTKRPALPGVYGRSILLLLVFGLGVVVTTGLAALALPDIASGALGVFIRVLATITAVVLNTGLFVLAMRVLVSAPLTLRDVLPGAICAGLLWQALQQGGAYLVVHELRGTSATYGLFGIVLGLLLWLYLSALIFLICSEVNVVRVHRLWPRSLASMFTDHARLTQADRRTYRRFATAEQRKTSQTIEVEFADQPAVPEKTVPDQTVPDNTEPDK